MERGKMNKKMILLSLLLGLGLNAGSVDTMIDKVGSTNAKSAASQKKINAYADTSEKLYDEYVRIQKELDEQRLYNRQLSLIVSTQKEEIPKLEEQISQIEVTHKKIIPLMFEMVETLDKLIAVDTPFLHDERTQRATNLKSYLSNPDITIAEQFRLIFESYKIEYSYARTLEVYRTQFDGDGSKTVDFLRVGRFALYYQSLDLQESAIYDLENQKWVILDPKYNPKIRKAIKMARKKVAPDFLTLPILAAKAVK